ncbi:conserved hypothetical protein [Xylella fastidiosa Temecula1]|uniref:DUF2065 domain-containing protein n=5 Tax=Xylella fastidiosa TaxID=2371 RepID=Q87B32_XYLFT|nr:conserved hypothetical protein [Xylella fastidiosa Temecula1]
MVSCHFCFVRGQRQLGAFHSIVFNYIRVFMYDLFVALSLVAVLEGLFLFLAPALWKRLATQLLDLPLAQLRLSGMFVLGVGLLVLWWLRH